MQDHGGAGCCHDPQGALGEDHGWGQLLKRGDYLLPSRVPSKAAKKATTAEDILPKSHLIGPARLAGAHSSSSGQVTPVKPRGNLEHASYPAWPCEICCRQKPKDRGKGLFLRHPSVVLQGRVL